MRRICISAVLLSLIVFFLGQGLYAVEYPGTSPGTARNVVSGSEMSLENNLIKMSWSSADKRLKPIEFAAKEKKSVLSLKDTECFSLVTVRSPHPKQRLIKSSEMTLSGPVRATRLQAEASAVSLSQRHAGWQYEADLKLAEIGLEVAWKAELRDGANYIRQSIKIQSKEEPIEIVEIVLFDGSIPGGKTAGLVDGSPVVSDSFFLGVENPGSKNIAADSGLVKCSYPFFNAVTDRDPFELSCVLGVYPDGQLRRGFLYYVERERCCPYRIFLHHNNGERIGEEYYALIKAKKEKEAADYRAAQEKLWSEIICSVGEALKKRGVTLASYAHDYEWDDEQLVWQFHNGYPNGFDSIAKDVERYDSRLGIWFSPWGGYSGRKFRMQGGPPQGLELNQQHNTTSFSMAGPRYYSRFRAASVNMIRDYAVNYFKFDGFLGSGRAMGPDVYRSDFEALWRLLSELRKVQPDVFINTSTGSWPSPFWLLRTDAIWRGGSDTGLSGAKGSLRQQWITYRDLDVRNRTLVNGPLFPISSLMIHGLMVNKGGRVKTFNEQDIIDEIYSFFATGVNLQELYIDPEVMNDRLWDTVAEAAKWSQANSSVMADVHWAGGDPGKLEVYGWAAWSPSKAVLSLRNPDDKPAKIAIDPAVVFELPQGAKTSFLLKSPWKKDASSQPIVLTAGKQHTFELKPFEILTFDALPK